MSDMALAEFYGFWSYNELVHVVYKLGDHPVIWEGMIFRMNIGLMGSYPDGIWEELMEPQIYRVDRDFPSWSSIRVDGD